MYGLHLEDVMSFVDRKDINWDILAQLNLKNVRAQRLYNEALHYPEFVEAIYKQGTFVFS